MTSNIVSSGHISSYFNKAHIIWVEPHYDDFIINGYSLWKNLSSRTNDDKIDSITLISMSISQSNKQNGMRGMASNIDSTKFKHIELGLPDIVWDKKFKNAYGSNVNDNDLLDIYGEYYHGNMIELCDNINKLIYIDAILHSYCRISIVMLPLAESYSHPYHRWVSNCISIDRSNLVSLVYYVDNPYCLNNSFEYKKCNIIHNLSEEDLARKYSYFCTYWSSQYTGQVLWNRNHILKNSYEGFIIP